MIVFFQRPEDEQRQEEGVEKGSVAKNVNL